LFYDPEFDSGLTIIINDLCALYLLFFKSIKFYLIMHKVTFKHWNTIVVNTFLVTKTQSLEFKRTPLLNYEHKTTNIVYEIVD
jgi:hypothetical protein